MKAIVIYTVNCSHEAFQYAMEKHMPNAKFHEIAWRFTENYGDDTDADFYSSFMWPNDRHLELTKALFFKMAFTALSCWDKCRATAFYVGIVVKDDKGKNALSINDGIQISYSDKEYPPSMNINENAFNEDMAERLKQIERIASETSDEK